MTDLLRVLVVDDEPMARRRLVRFLGEAADVRVAGECAGGREAVERIREDAPDLVFLDVQMPDLDGFGVIEAVGPERMPSVVFVTAYDAYALRAFDVHAVDYLLKPYDDERFHRALERARRRRSTAEQPIPGEDRLRALVRDAVAAAQAGEGGGPEGADRIAVRVDGVVRIVRTADVDYFETDGNYVRMHVGRESHLIRNSAARLEQQLAPRQFVRIHRRYLVNLDRVLEVQPWFGGDAVVVLRDGTKLRLSRGYRESFNARLLGEGPDVGGAGSRR